MSDIRKNCINQGCTRLATKKYVTCSTCRRIHIASSKLGRPVQAGEMCTRCGAIKNKDNSVLNPTNGKPYAYCKKCKDEKDQKAIADKALRMNAKKCNWIDKSGKQCPNQDKEHGFCKLHINKGLVQLDESNGIFHCSNHNRGCKNILPDNKYTRCQTCRDTSKENDQKRRTILELKKTDNPDKIIDGINYSFCIYCPGGKYKPTAYTSSDEPSIKCQDCLDQTRTIDKTRVAKPRFIYKIMEYKNACKNPNKNKKWNLSDEYAFFLFGQPCFYCNKQPTQENLSGIDRCNNDNREYSKNNVVSCCNICNRMKAGYTLEDFYSICEHIATFNNLIENGRLFPHLFRYSTNTNYQSYKSCAEKKSTPFSLSEEEFNNLVKQDCHYCGLNKANSESGVDRINSDLGYTMDNVVSCCTICNLMKNDLNKEVFLNQCAQIYNIFTQNTKKPDEVFDLLQIENELFESFINLDPNNISANCLDTSKFIHPDYYYLNKMFNGNLDDIVNIQIELEFIHDNRQQRDLWNYYRLAVSTLKMGRLQGRQIYVLVKDKVTNTYLGILSFNSDIKELKARDNYIGWNKDAKIGNMNLNYLMNMSTCVPLIPFGYNFCGGKLLASLAFSKEISEHIFNKYNTPLLGINTTSLYGKSVQYSRLPDLKFIGLTSGHGTCHIPDSLYKKCLEYLKKSKIDTSCFIHPSSRKMNKIGLVLSELGIDKNSVFQHGNQRGIYFGYTHPNSKNLLNTVDETSWSLDKLSEKGVDFNNMRSAQEIFNWWYQKYAIKRYNHLSSQHRLQKSNTIRTISQGKHNLQQRSYMERQKAKLGDDAIKEKNREYMKLYRMKTKLKKTQKSEPELIAPELIEPEQELIAPKPKKQHTEETKSKIAKSCNGVLKKYNQSIIDDIIAYKKNPINYTQSYVAKELSKKHGLNINRTFVARIYQQY